MCECYKICVDNRFWAVLGPTKDSNNNTDGIEHEIDITAPKSSIVEK